MDSLRLSSIVHTFDWTPLDNSGVYGSNLYKLEYIKLKIPRDAHFWGLRKLTAASEGKKMSQLPPPQILAGINGGNPIPMCPPHSCRRKWREKLPYYCFCAYEKSNANTFWAEKEMAENPVGSSYLKMQKKVKNMRFQFKIQAQGIKIHDDANHWNKKNCSSSSAKLIVGKECFHLNGYQDLSSRPPPRDYPKKTSPQPLPP